MQRDRVGRHVPSGRRLHARREAAVNDAIGLGANLLQLFSPEVRVRFLRAEDPGLCRLAQHGGAGRDVEGAGSGLRVVDHPLAVDPVAPGDVGDVPVGDHSPLFLEELHVIREELHVIAVDLDGLIGGSLHDVVIFSQPDPAHVLRLGELAPPDLRLCPRDGRGAEPFERDGYDQDEDDSTHEPGGQQPGPGISEEYHAGVR